MSNDQIPPSDTPAVPSTPPPRSEPLPWAETPPRAVVPLARRIGRVATTVLCLAVIIGGGLTIWDSYITSPWTRDGTVRVQVANVAPQVSGQIVELRVVDNQFVHKGDVLYVIDPFDFRVKLESAKATVKQQAADYQVKRVQSERLQNLNTLATTAQQQQQAAGAADQAQGALQYAQQQQDQAEINLKRTEVASPVNGFVNNLLLRVGDYAQAGQSDVSVIDTDSYWIDGYFDETKLANICVGDPVEAKLMGFRTPIKGRIDTVGRGISVSNAAPSTQGLPSVNAVYTWVRLAQRVPVHIQITDVPTGVPLISGLTATVTVRKAATGVVDVTSGLLASIRDIVSPPDPKPGCIPSNVGGIGPTARIPEPKARPAQPPEQIDPGLADGMTSKPQTQP